MDSSSLFRYPIPVECDFELLATALKSKSSRDRRIKITGKFYTALGFEYSEALSISSMKEAEDTEYVIGEEVSQ